MAIYKLGDIGEFKGGISNLQKNKYDKGINFINYMDIFNNSIIDKNTILRKYDANHKDIFKYGVKYGDIFFTATSETSNEIAFSAVYLLNEPAIFNGFSKRYRFNHLILNPKYAGYFFRSLIFRNIVKKYATGYTRYNIKQSDLYKIEINIPNLKTQKQIIDIIEPYEKLFLSYSKCVRIDNIKNTKKDIKNLIDIIEPYEIGIKSIKKIIFMLKIIRINLYKATIFKNIKLCNIATAKSGKQPPLSEHINTSNKNYIRFIQNRDYSDYKIKSYILSSFKGTKVDEMDIVIDKYGEPGQMRYGIRGFINVAMLKIIPFKKHYKESIRNHFENEIFLKWLKRSSQASTRASLNWNFLKTLKIGLSNNDELLSLFILLELKLKEINYVMKSIKNKIIKILIK